jgi:hypothetical protein
MYMYMLFRILTPGNYKFIQCAVPRKHTRTWYKVQHLMTIIPMPLNKETESYGGRKLRSC